MVLSSLHTLWVLYSVSSALSHTFVASLASPSVSRRPTSFAKTSSVPQATPLASTLLRWWRVSLTYSCKLHHFQLPLPRLGQWTNVLEEQQSSSTSGREGLGQHGVDHQHQDAPRGSETWTFYSHQNQKSRHLPPALPQKDFRHHLARPTLRQLYPR